MEVAERIRHAVEKSVFTNHDGGHIAVTASIGVTRLQQDEPAQESLRRADDALYRAKREGRNQVVVALASNDA